MSPGLGFGKTIVALGGAVPPARTTRALGQKVVAVPYLKPLRVPPEAAAERCLRDGVFISVNLLK